MAKKQINHKKRNWIDRMVNVFQDLELNKLYSPPDIRDSLKTKYNDSISHKTVRELLDKIINAQDGGIQFIQNKNIRKLIMRSTNKGKLYELIEIEN